jgi:hypothetical protein
MSNHTWELIKLAFRYFARGFERIIFMILGAEIAFIMCYLFFCEFLYRDAIPALPAGFAVGSLTLSGAMVMSGVTAVIYTIYTLLGLAAVGLIVGYIRYYLAVLSYYNDSNNDLKRFRAPKTPDWLMAFDIGKEKEQIRLATIEECKQRIAEIKRGE